MKKFMDSVVVLDTETGGLNPYTDALLTVGLSGPFDTFMEWPVLDFGRCLPEAMNVNKIDLREHRQKALPPLQVLKEIEEFLRRVKNMTASESAPEGEKLYIAGHNVHFDLAFLRRLVNLAHPTNPDLPRWLGGRTIDTHTLLWAEHAKGKIAASATSSEGAFRHFGIKVEESERHTALGDAKATRRLLEALLNN
jgi:DNA polymerase III epsilon subunit-like protein